MGLVNTVVGTLVILAIGAVIYGAMFVAQMVYHAIPVEETRGIVCVMPVILIGGYFIGSGIHDYRKTNKKA